MGTSGIIGIIIIAIIIIGGLVWWSNSSSQPAPTGAGNYQTSASEGVQTGSTTSASSTSY